MRRASLLAALAALAGCHHLDGELAANATPLGTWTFEPTRCTASNEGLVLSSVADPLVYVAIERVAGEGAAAPSILAPQVPMRLVVLALAKRDGAPLAVPSSECQVLSLDASRTHSTRINNGPWVQSYGGVAEVDCAAGGHPHGFVGRFRFNCPER